MEALYIAAGMLLGALIAWAVTSRLNHKEKARSVQEKKDLENRLILVESSLESNERFAREKISDKDHEIKALKEESVILQERLISLNTHLARQQEEVKFANQKLEDQKIEIQQLRQSFNQEFENISNKLFKAHSKEFTETSQQKLNDLLNPLKEKITAFETKVSEAYDKEVRDKISLREEVRQLYQLNQRISEEAGNLTRALKGDVKMMGNWGEVLLERILEQSGLEKGSMYLTQVSGENEEGKKYQPDVVVYLPDKKHIVIDAKVSLLAYERYTTAESDEERQQFIKDHLASVYNHVRILSSKNYQDLSGINSPDFVLLFIPVEASFSAAVREDAALFDFAWKNKIVIVSPSTLLATLKTIQSIWKQENQTRNALEIATQGGRLYDKFVGFVEDLGKIGTSLSQTRRAYEEAMNKLHTGKGNLVSRVESLRKLGVKPAKNLPEKLTDSGEIPFIQNESTE